MITVRAGPNNSIIAGPICQTKYMLKAMCSNPACSHPALNTVHQRPSPKTGPAPLAPNTISTAELGDSADIRLPPPTEAPDISSVITHSVTQTQTTSCAHRNSAPSARSIGPKPHSPGLDRPHV